MYFVFYFIICWLCLTTSSKRKCCYVMLSKVHDRQTTQYIDNCARQMDNKFTHLALFPLWSAGSFAPSTTDRGIEGEGPGLRRSRHRMMDPPTLMMSRPRVRLLRKDPPTVTSTTDDPSHPVPPTCRRRRRLLWWCWGRHSLCRCPHLYSTKNLRNVEFQTDRQTYNTTSQHFTRLPGVVPN